MLSQMTKRCRGLTFFYCIPIQLWTIPFRGPPGVIVFTNCFPPVGLGVPMLLSHVLVDKSDEFAFAPVEEG